MTEQELRRKLHRRAELLRKDIATAQLVLDYSIPELKKIEREILKSNMREAICLQHPPNIEELV